VAGRPLWRISRLDLDKLMATLEIRNVRLSACELASDAELGVTRENAPTIHFGLEGLGHIVVDDEPPIRLAPHTLVIVPRNRSQNVLGCERALVPHWRAARPAGVAFVPGLTQRHHAGHGAASLTLVCGYFQAEYGAAFDLFASLESPIVETFDAHDQLGQLLGYAIAELAAEEVGGGSMSKALLKLVLLALLRRSLISSNPWVERFAILNDPPIARAFAEMASRPSLQHTVQTLAHHACLGRSAFMARFASAFGESPMSVLRRLRMRNAAALLAANALSIDQVALLAGYQSRSSFTRTFRKFYGIDPSDYRAGMRSATSDVPKRVHGPFAPEERAIAD
jgi:AraC family transcriptional regulator, activator of mtrCDE